ncbi:MAG TPA: FtsX-like permease family protein [Candidatus Micrarchaeaceae archaeon]|nr:FtsX-like permease family protein [Candidatus Micrarchaeaceae archaeon]
MWQLVLTRLRRRWALSLALWLGLIASIGFAGAAAMVQASAGDANLQLFLKGLGANGDVTVSESDKNDVFLIGTHPNPAQAYKAFQAVVAERTQSLTGGLLRVTDAWAVSTQFSVTTINGRPYTNLSSPSPVFAAYEGIDSHIAIVGTRQPPAGDTAVPVAMTEAGAAAMDIKIGDLLCLGDTEPPLCVRVVTLWRPLDPNDPYLLREQVPAGGMFVSIDRFYQTLAAYPDDAASAYARLNVDLTAAHGYTPAETLDRANAITNGLSSLSISISVQTGLVNGLTDFVGRASIAQFAIQLVATQVLALALLYVAFASGHVLDQQGQLFAAWRGRGWSPRRVFAVVMTESALMTLLALPFGLVVAYAAAATVSSVVYRTLPYGLGISDLGLPIGVALVVILAVLAVQAIRASRRELLDVRRSESRPETRPWWQWRYVDLGLAALSIPILLELRTIGQANLRAAGLSATDPLTTSLPVMALIFLTVAALRLLPFLARLVGRAGRGLASSMASSQFARHPSAHAGAALLLSVSIALGLFASIYATTASQNAADRAAYSVGSDIRLSDSSDHRPAFDALTAQLSGVQAKSFASRFFGNFGTSGGAYIDVLGVDPYTMKGVAWSRPGLNSASLTDLIDRLARKEQGGMLLGGQPKALTLWVYTTGGLAVDLTANVTDADGQPCNCGFGVQNQAGWTQVSAQLKFAHPPTYPLRFRSLMLGAVKVFGTIAISDLQVDGTELESFSSPQDWTASDSVNGLYNLPLKADRIVPRNGIATVAFMVSQSQGNFVVRPPSSADPIPALASTATLAMFNLVQNQPFIASVNGYPIQLVIVGVADQFPSLYQENGPWLVVARDPFLAALNQVSGYAVWPNQAWYTVDPAADRADLALIQRDYPQVTALDRRDLVAAAASDPLWLGLESNLLTGALTCLALGIAAFALHFLVTAKGRLSEYAVLEGSGLPRALIWRSLFIEQLVVLAFSLGTGIVFGVLLSFVLLPSLQLGNTLLDTVPATVVTINPLLVAAVLGAVLAVAVIAGRLAARTGGGYKLMDELRSLG